MVSLSFPYLLESVFYDFHIGLDDLFEQHPSLREWVNEDVVFHNELVKMVYKGYVQNPLVSFTPIGSPRLFFWMNDSILR